MLKRHLKNTIVLALLTLVLITETSFAVTAETPAERMLAKLPDDTIGFVATSGFDAYESDFNKSMIGQIWHEPSVQQFYEQIKQTIKTKIDAKQDDQDKEQMEHVCSLLRLIGRCPAAAGILPTGDLLEGKLAFFLMVEAGDRQEAIQQALTSLLKSTAQSNKIQPTRIGSYDFQMRNIDNGPLMWGWIGHTLVVMISPNTLSDDKALEIIRYIPADASRSKPLPAQRYISMVQSNGDALLMHVDIEDTISKLMLGIEKLEAKDPSEKKYSPRIRSSLAKLGIADMKTFTCRWGFAGQYLEGGFLYRLKDPPGGLWSALGKVDLAALDPVPQTAVNVGTSHANFARAYDVIMETIEAVTDQQEFSEIQTHLTNFETELGIKIKDDLLATMEGDLVCYTVPAGAIASAQMGGIVGLMNLTDGTRFEQALTKLEQYIVAKTQKLSAAGPPASMMSLKVQTQPVAGRQVHTWVLPPLAMMQIIPCWSVSGNRLILTSNPSLCLSAELPPDKIKTDSIRVNENFKKICSNLPPNLATLRYTNTPVAFAQMMMIAQQVWPTIASMAASENVSLPPMLPILDQLIEKIEPSCCYTWFSTEGLHGRVRSSVPVQGGIQIGVAGMAVSIMMPALAQARQAARRLKCATQLSELGKAFVLYQNDHQGKNPPALADLIAESNLPKKLLICPGKGSSRDTNSYIYRGDDLTENTPADMILIYDRFENHKGKFRNVLFADMHVDKMSESEFLQAIQKDNELRKQQGLTEKQPDGPTKKSQQQPATAQPL